MFVPADASGADPEAGRPVPGSAAGRGVNAGAGAGDGCRQRSSCCDCCGCCDRAARAHGHPIGSGAPASAGGHSHDHGAGADSDGPDGTSAHSNDHSAGADSDGPDDTSAHSNDHSAGADVDGPDDTSAHSNDHSAGADVDGPDGTGGGPVPIPEGLSEMTPGPCLAGLLARIPVGRVSGYDTVEVMVAAYRQGNHDRGVFLRAVLETGMRRAGSAETVARVQHPGEFAAEEARAALVFSRRRADATFGLAYDVHLRLPLLGEAMLAGQLDEARAQAFAQYTAGLSDDQAAQVCAHLLPRAPGMLVGALIDAIKRAAIAIDPDYAERRYRQAVKTRRIEGSRNPDGSANIAGLNLPVDRAAAACERVDALATRCKQAGDRRPIDHIRVDLYLGMLDGSYEQLDDTHIIAHILGQHHDHHDGDRPDDGPAGNSPSGGGNDGADSDDGDGGRDHGGTRTDRDDGDGDGDGDGGRDHGGTRTDRGDDGDGGDGDGGGDGDDGGSDRAGDTRDNGGSPPGNSPNGNDGDDSDDERDDGDTRTDRGHGDDGGSDRAGDTPDNGGSPPGNSPNGNDGDDSDDERDDGDTRTDRGHGDEGDTRTDRGDDDRGSDRAGDTPKGVVEEEGARGGRCDAPPERRAVRELRVSLSSMLGLDECPGEIVGWDFITATLARGILVAMTAAEWRWVVCGPDGRPLTCGITTRRPRARQGVRGRGIVELQARADQFDQLIAAAHAQPDWAPVIADIVTQHHAAHAETTAGHPGTPSRGVGSGNNTADDDAGDAHRRVAGARLRRAVQVRDRSCTHPSCRMPATRTDQDHTVDHAHGGRTTQQNLGSRCRHDHRLKHDGGWDITNPTATTTIWTSVLAHTYVNHTEPVLPPLPRIRARYDGQAGDGQAGDGQAGDEQAGHEQAGDEQAGDGQAGDEQAGHELIGDDGVWISTRSHRSTRVRRLDCGCVNTCRCAPTMPSAEPRGTSSTPAQAVPARRLSHEVPPF